MQEDKHSEDHHPDRWDAPPVNAGPLDSRLSSDTRGPTYLCRRGPVEGTMVRPLLSIPPADFARGPTGVPASGRRWWSSCGCCFHPRLPIPPHRVRTGPALIPPGRGQSSLAHVPKTSSADIAQGRCSAWVEIGRFRLRGPRGRRQSPAVRCARPNQASQRWRPSHGPPTPAPTRL